MDLDARLQELEDGLRDVFRGIRAELQAAEAVIADLRARLEERRLMGTEAPIRPVTLDMPTPLPSLRKRGPRRRITETVQCTTCPATFEWNHGQGAKMRRFCDRCLNLVKSEQARIQRAREEVILLEKVDALNRRAQMR